jgi:hypothetical protein
VSATARLNQFCGLPANASQPDVDDKPLTHTPNANVFRIVAVAEQAVADGLRVESDSNHKPHPRLPRINGDGPLEEIHLRLQEEHIETARLTKSPAS